MGVRSRRARALGPPRERVRVSFLPSCQAASSRPAGPRETGVPPRLAIPQRTSQTSNPAAPALQRTEKRQGDQPASAGHPLLSSLPTSETARTQPALECRSPFSPAYDSPIAQLSTGTNTTPFRGSDPLCKMATGSGREQ